MADKLDALAAAITADAGFTALAGNRFFIKGGRQGAAYPYAVFDVISTDSAIHLEGNSDLEAIYVQIECYAETADGARALRTAIKTVLDVPSVTAAGVTFSTTFQNQRGPAPDEETRKHRADLDCKLW